MKKIVIIGSSGSGKSTFAQKLGRILGIKVFHLDRHFWKPGWKEHSMEDRIQIEYGFMNGRAQWIIEGSYLSSSDNRLSTADTIIFLDMPPYLCLIGVIMRHIKYQGYERSDLPKGCTDRISLASILKIVLFPLRGRRLLLKKFAELCAEKASTSSQKTVIMLSSRKEVENFLHQQADEWQKEYMPTDYKLAG